ncbi:hypothetical protein ACHAWC_010497 [Mediolabrus comicus]
MAEERPDYDALAQDINLNDITSCERNAIFLRMLRDGDPNWNKRLTIVYEWEQYDEEEDMHDGEFVVREGDDLGWLGYFIGRSEVLQDLQILPLPAGMYNYFFDGISQNRSIKGLVIDSVDDDISWISLCSFLGNNHNLSCLEFHTMPNLIGHEGAQNLALALGRMNHNSLEHLLIQETQVGDEGIAKIATTLRLQSQLKILQLYDNNIGREGCIALANTLSIWPHSNKLEMLDLSCNSVDDGGLHAVVSGLMNCRSLKQLYIWGNRSITAAGLRSLTPLLQSESHSLEAINLCRINFGDDGAMALTEGLRGNKFLKELSFDVETAGITTIGWSAFSTLLCDTSTISKTYLSNHTLTIIASEYNNEPQDIVQYLAINEHSNAAICKILQSHPDLDMEPFFNKKMQFLPAVMSWFERVEPIEDQLIEDELIEESERSCQNRKLSALYKFVRAMPDLTIIGYWEGRMIHIEAKKRRLADEMRRLEYEEDIARERLGMSGQPMDEASTNK